MSRIKKFLTQNVFNQIGKFLFLVNIHGWHESGWGRSRVSVQSEDGGRIYCRGGVEKKGREGLRTAHGACQPFSEISF